MRRILGKIISFNNKIRNLEAKIEENQIRINEIKKLRKGKVGRASKEEQALVDEKHDLERQNRKNRSKIREYKKELQLYIDIKDAVSLMLKSKAKKTELNRYDKIRDNIDDVPKEARAFIKNISKELDALLLHTEDDDIPITNNLIELYHLTTLNRRDKKKYKTIEGVFEDTLLMTIRWEERIVLCND